MRARDWFLLAIGLAACTTRVQGIGAPGEINTSSANNGTKATTGDPQSPRSAHSTLEPAESPLPSLDSRASHSHPPAPAALPSAAMLSRDSNAERDTELVPLVPEVAARRYQLSDGPRAFQNRLSFSPGAGRLGKRDLYVLRFAYNSVPWLGYEATLGHNPGRSVHAALYMVNAVARVPLPFRVQPYGTAGYGMIFVFPGQALNASSVTENAFAAGGGLELYLRNDLAIRGEMRRIWVPGDDPNGGSAVYEYGEGTLSLSFYRTIDF